MFKPHLNPKQSKCAWPETCSSLPSIQRKRTNMKNYFVNFALLLTLAGCGIIDPQDQAPRDRVPKVEQKLAGYVSFLIGTEKGKEPKLPESFEVKFYPEADPSQHIQMLPTLPAEMVEFDAADDSTLRFGCDGSEPVIKEDIKTGILELCGPVLFKGRNLNIVATKIIYNNVDLNFELFGPKTAFDSEDLVFIRSLEIELKGANRISVYRDVSSRGKAEAPHLIMNIDRVYGDGKLQINSISEFPLAKQ